MSDPLNDLITQASRACFDYIDRAIMGDGGNKLNDFKCQMDFEFAKQMASAFDGIYPVHAVILNEYAITLTFAYIQKDEHIELVWHKDVGSGWMHLLDANGAEKQSIIEVIDNYDQLIEQAKTFLRHEVTD